MTKPTSLIAGAALVLAALGCATPTVASESALASPPIRTLVQKECGACHIAYLPKYLPESAWTTLFNGLDNHFGENARMAPEATAAVRRYYIDNAAGLYWTSPSTSEIPRITAQAWWKRGMGKLDVASPRIRSRANCGACHTHAEWYMAVRE